MSKRAPRRPTRCAACSASSESSFPQGIGHFIAGYRISWPTATMALPGPMRALLHRLLAQLKALDQQVAELKGEIVTWHLHDEDSRRLERIGGFGPLTASALVASLGNARSFKNGRQVAAWLGLVPRQDSSGGKTRLLGISKHGDVYLRTLLIHGARAVLRHLGHREPIEPMTGCSGCWPGATRTSLPSRSPTRTHVSPGPCSHIARLRTRLQVNAPEPITKEQLPPTSRLQRQTRRDGETGQTVVEQTCYEPRTYSSSP